MDPNANLTEQEALLQARAQDTSLDLLKDPRPWRMAQADHERLWDLRQALYDWIREGGVEPDWSKAPKAAAFYGKS